VYGDDLPALKTSSKETHTMHDHKYSAMYAKPVWRTGLRVLVLARDPICKICNRYPSVVADHIKPHLGNWDLFTDLNNLQGLCEHCHNVKTATEDGGFGNIRPQPVSTFAGQPGVVTAVGAAALDAALGSDDEIAALLAGIP
jgi:5-methylcytosine-specific restriction enzyme A